MSKETFEPGKHPNSLANLDNKPHYPGEVKKPTGLKITPTAKRGLMDHGGVSPVVEKIGRGLATGDRVLIDWLTKHSP